MSRWMWEQCILFINIYNECYFPTKILLEEEHSIHLKMKSFGIPNSYQAETYSQIFERVSWRSFRIPGKCHTKGSCTGWVKLRPPVLQHWPQAARYVCLLWACVHVCISGVSAPWNVKVLSKISWDWEQKITTFLFGKIKTLKLEVIILKITFTLYNYFIFQYIIIYSLFNREHKFIIISHNVLFGD